MQASKRQFLGLGAGLLAGSFASAAFTTTAMAQTMPGPSDEPPRRAVPHRKATTTVLFMGPKGKYLNGVATSPDGLWLSEQKELGGPNSSYHYKDGRPLEPYADLHENAWLVDDKGAVKKTVALDSRNTSGFCVGGGNLWAGGNLLGHNGVTQAGMDGKTISLRQVPFGPPSDGGGIHGMDYANGKLWIASLRLKVALRLDAASWQTEIMLPFPPGFARFHGCAYDASNDTLLVITGNDSTGYANGTPGLVRLDAKTGAMVETIEFEKGACDPHGLTFHQGKLISCDAGLHPGWPLNDSPFSGAIFQVNIV